MNNSARFIGHLEALAAREERGGLAALRLGLGKPPGAVAGMMPHVVPYLPQDEREHWAYFLVGSLFALHPESASEGNMGSVFRLFGEHESAQKRFISLLDSHVDEVGKHLRHAISMAKAKQVRVNYRGLLDDLVRWTHATRQVQLRWAREYWGSRGNEGEENETSAVETAAE